MVRLIVFLAVLQTGFSVIIETEACQDLFFHHQLYIMMIRFLSVIALLAIVPMLTVAQTLEYKTVEGDPLNARIYTLDNGLKVYLSVNESEPRIQTYIPVNVGSKNDPSETTGLAHYFEHMMFKGTPKFGTTDWEAERVLIDSIEALFEVYRTLTDPEERLELYKQIDAVSYEASKYAIPNEYDKLMKQIGSKGTNAGTSTDYTIYIENIPKNQIRNWAIIQAERFSSPVLRLFHTELETVYEEKNMSLTNDGRRASEAMMTALFPNHPYGQQTTLGEAEHLKNPSMTTIKQFYEQYYVPNNMAVCMSGDFDPDEVIVIIQETFGKLEPGDVPEFELTPEDEITTPKEVDVVGLEAESVRIGFRFPGAGTEESLLGDMMSLMLRNGKAGLIDLNVNQKQRTLWASSYFFSMNDYSNLVISAGNKGGQTLEETRDILLEQVEKLKAGDFPDWLLEAAINNLKLREMKVYESNAGRARTMANAFMRNIPWERQVGYLDLLSDITKASIVEFANEHLKDNYAVIYKRQGEPEDVTKVDKPPITPIHINRDVESDFFRMIADTEVEEIEPVFLDYDTDIARGKTQSGIDVLYKVNEENATFNLIYYFPLGSDHDKMINMAAGYLDYLGTSTMSPEEIKQEFYKLACSFSVSASRDNTYISISGLSDQQEKALELLENLLADCQPNEEALSNMIDDIHKGRDDAKANQRANFMMLTDYATYGEISPAKNVLSSESLKALTPEALINVLRQMNGYEHEVIYYGPSSIEDVITMIDKKHHLPEKRLNTPGKVEFTVQETPGNKVYFAHYDANQSYLQTIQKGIDYDETIIPRVNMYNAYFSGGMNAIVFQEMREKRGLAYSSYSRYNMPSDTTQPFTSTSFIATQNDKIVDAFDAFNELFDDMPISERAFNLAKETMLTDMRTNRVTNMSVIWNYISARKMGRDYDLRKVLYEEIPKMHLNDVIYFNKKYISGQPKTYVILGNENDIDFDAVKEKYGEVTKLDKETYFGY